MSEQGENIIVTTSPDVLSGTPVFAGTRVPIQTLMDYLEGGDSIDEFLDGFPTVTREQVIGFLEAAKERMLATME
ncbi:MAG: DUF433 domain-containing protein [Ktedonobacteraceae bacterium]|nr:DUF433 domain-containing protein [Ktedonobacteraceae bacterium]MBA3944254.1 DUF433 domain-containing protein [Herpetosiphonaceae bacterium]